MHPTVVSLLHAVRKKASTLRTAVWTAQDQDEDQLKGAKDIRRWALLLKEMAGIPPPARSLVELILAEAVNLTSREQQDVRNHALIESCAQALINALEGLPEEEPDAPEPLGAPVDAHPAHPRAA